MKLDPSIIGKQENSSYRRKVKHFSWCLTNVWIQIALLGRTIQELYADVCLTICQNKELPIWLTLYMVKQKNQDISDEVEEHQVSRKIETINTPHTHTQTCVDMYRHEVLMILFNGME
jgi:hypothetical protein